MKRLKAFFMRNRYRKDITFILLLKVIALILLWKLFFSHPVEPQIDSQALGERLMSSAAETSPHP
jgi:hypothetical protein